MLRNRTEIPLLDELYPLRQRDGDEAREDEEAIEERESFEDDLDDDYVPGFDDPDKECLMCKKIRDEHSGFGPSHNGSRFCESGSIASGGKRSHCTCDMCF